MEEIRMRMSRKKKENMFGMMILTDSRDEWKKTTIF